MEGEMPDSDGSGAVPAGPAAGSSENSTKVAMEQKKPTWLSLTLSLLPLLAIVGTFFGIGYQLGKDKDEALQTFLKEQVKDSKERNEDAQKKLDQAEQAVALLKNDLNICKASPQREGTEAPTHPSATNAGEAEIQVITGETAKLFSGQLFVSVSAVQPSPTDPPRYQAFATLGAPGQKSEDFHGYTGQAVVFDGFEARLTQVNAASARFHVRKLSQPPSP
jgi:hypothetical protein